MTATILNPDTAAAQAYIDALTQASKDRESADVAAFEALAQRVANVLLGLADQASLTPEDAVKLLPSHYTMHELIDASLAIVGEIPVMEGNQ